MYRFHVGEFVQRFPIILLGFFILFNAIVTLADRSSDVTFQFPEYDYKETSKNVMPKQNSEFIDFIETLREFLWCFFLLCVLSFLFLLNTGTVVSRV